jgi:hypothetical protein
MFLVTFVCLLGFFWWVTLVTNETELSPNVVRERVQNILKITGKDEKRNKGSKSNTNLIHFYKFLVLLGFNASTCFGRHSPILRRPCTNATWCNYVRKMCVGGAWVGVLHQRDTPPTHILRTQIHQVAFVQGLLMMNEWRPKHVEVLNPNKIKKLKKCIKLVFDLLHLHVHVLRVKCNWT